MASVEFSLSEFYSAFADLQAGLRNAAHQALKSAVDDAYDSAKTTALFKDGPKANLRGSIEKGIPEALEGFIKAGGRKAPYGRYVEDGTVPHDIVAKKGGMLRFVSGGTTFFRRRVRHKGTTARPFMAVAGKVGEQSLDYGLDYYAESPIAYFNRG